MVKSMDFSSKLFTKLLTASVGGRKKERKGRGDETFPFVFLTQLLFVKIPQQAARFFYWGASCLNSQSRRGGTD